MEKGYARAQVPPQTSYQETSLDDITEFSQFDHDKIISYQATNTSCHTVRQNGFGLLFWIMGSKNWCFTLNNYTEEDVARVNTLVADSDGVIEYLIYGKEIAESGTPHLQGFLTCKQRVRMARVKNLIGSNPHLECARNVNASILYCKKDGDWVEFGSRTNGRQGSRSDLDDFKQAVKGGMLSLTEIREHHSDVYAKYHRFCLEYIDDHYPTVELPDHDLRPWQVTVKNLLEEPADRRKIIFLVDEVGNSGKSWFAHYYTRLIGETAQVLLPGRKADMAYALRPGLRVLFLDAPRSKQGEFIQYDFLEDLKNGYVFSTKYESRIKSFEPMHVVVNMNEAPDRTKLSADRFKIINLRQL